jgi:hypothetical protein
MIDIQAYCRDLNIDTIEEDEEIRYFTGAHTIPPQKSTG